MKKIKVQRFISFTLAVMMMFGLLAGTSVSADNGFTETMPDDFVQGEVLAPADSLEHAREIAKVYDLELESYAYGIAVLIAPNPEHEVSQSHRMRSAGVPNLSFNRIYTTYTVSPVTTPISPSMRSIERYNEKLKLDEKLRLDEAGWQTYSASNYQWHHEEMDNERAWGITKGAGVVVAVIDTGIDTNHPDFAGRISSKSYNSHTDQIGLAYVQDDYGHGTHVSGIAAGAVNNSENVSGVAPEAQILAIKANMPTSPNSFDSASLYRAINYAAENGAAIINMSLGRSYIDAYDELEHNIIIDAVEKGVTVICAAGNDRYSHAGYPAAYPEVIAVSATRQGYTFDNSYSNYGPEIAVAAPGSSIYATANGGGYVHMSGTSMASPNVAGTAALIKSLNPNYTPQEVREKLCETARQIGSLDKSGYYGWGIVNSYAAVIGSDALYSVTYDFNDGIRSPVTVNVVPSDKLFEPFAPLLNGYAFDKWCLSANGENAFDFTTEINGNITLYARWVQAMPSMYITEFPDANFRREVLRLVNGRDGGNRTDSSFIDAYDLSIFTSIESLYLNSMGIYDITGLGYLTKLTTLSCYDNQLTELDVSNNTALTYLSCDSNQLTKLDISANTALTILTCDNNQLTELDASKNTSLTSLFCFGNQLTVLDVSKNTALTQLSCDNNQLMVLDVSLNTSLTSLICRGNYLTELDVSNNTALTTLLCDHNQLTALDVSNNTALTELWCHNNQLTELNVMDSTILETLICYGNNLTELNVSNNTSLTGLWCYSNQLTTLDVSANTALIKLFCENNQLTELDVSANTSLIYLYCNSNQLTELDVSTNSALIELWCNDNQLTALNVSKNTSLEWLYCYNNRLMTLDVSANTALTQLVCYNNYIESPDDVIGWWNILALILDSTFYFYPQYEFVAPDYTALVSKIKEALSAVNSVIISADGSELWQGATDKFWVTKAEYDEFDEVLIHSYDVIDKAFAQNEVDVAVVNLDNAIQNLLAVRKVGTGMLNYSFLTEKIKEASAAKANVMISEDGSELSEETEYHWWVTQAVMDTFDNAIMTAIDKLISKNQAEIDAVVQNLTNAIKEFLSARQRGIGRFWTNYTIKGNLITDVLPQTNFSIFSGNFYPKIETDDLAVNVYTSSGALLADGDTVGTGMTVEIIIADEIAGEFEAVIHGDITGDGNTDIEDAQHFLEYLVGNYKLSESQRVAIEDYDNDDLAIKKLRDFLNAVTAK